MSFIELTLVEQTVSEGKISGRFMLRAQDIVYVAEVIKVDSREFLHSTLSTRNGWKFSAAERAAEIVDRIALVEEQLTMPQTTAAAAFSRMAEHEIAKDSQDAA